MSDARPLTPGETDLARSVFGDAIDYAPVRIVLGKWAFFQPRDVVMTPTGRLHFHPRGTAYRDDFSHAGINDQGLFIHEMTHVWQHQSGIFLPLKRVPWARYDYAVKPGWQLHKYGLEQQAEIVRHTFLIGLGATFAGAPPLSQLKTILPFKPSHPIDRGVA
ncbi:vgr related protein [Sphingomonas bacterium]|uniref:vgr related protein n=1 Tax=Sphingomonas bacterium TaxID=1895847 RepID=UPI002604CEFF|nr:vgr related protein [Sphingomonas bacterium]MDB5678946.1 vgr related protein [Sphingomonas bacterium]